MNLHDPLSARRQPSELFGNASVSEVFRSICNSIQRNDPYRSNELIERVQRKIGASRDEMTILAGFSYISLAIIQGFGSFVDGEVADQLKHFASQTRNLRMLSEMAPQTMSIIKKVVGSNGDAISTKITECLPNWDAPKESSTTPPSPAEPVPPAEHPLRLLSVLVHPDCPAMNSLKDFLALPRLLIELASARSVQENGELRQLIRSTFASFMNTGSSDMELLQDGSVEAEPHPGALISVLALHSPPTQSCLISLLGYIATIDTQKLVSSVNVALPTVEARDRVKALEGFLTARNLLLDEAKIPERVLNDLVRLTPPDSLFPFFQQAAQTPDIVRLYGRLASWATATSLSAYASMVLSRDNSTEIVDTLLKLTNKVGLRQQVAQLVACNQDVHTAGRLDEALQLLSRNPSPRIFESYLAGVVAGKGALVDAIASTVISNSSPKLLIEKLSDEDKAEFAGLFPQSLSRNEKQKTPPVIPAVTSPRKPAWADRLNELLPEHPSLSGLGLRLLNDGSPALQRSMRELIGMKPENLLRFLEFVALLPTVEQLGRALQNRSVLPHIMEILEERKTRKFEQLRSIFEYSVQLNDSELSSAILKVS